MTSFDPDRYGDVVFIPTFPETKPEFIEEKWAGGSQMRRFSHTTGPVMDSPGAPEYGFSCSVIVNQPSPSIDKEAQQPNFEEEVFDYSTETENERPFQHSGPKSSKLQMPAARRLLRKGAWSK